MKQEKEAAIAAAKELERLRLEAEQKAKDEAPVLDNAEIEAIRKKEFEEEEAARIAREAAEEAALAAEDESSEDEDSEEEGFDEDD